MRDCDEKTGGSTASTPPSGKVWLVGAGPGDEGLITVRGLELLRSADVVVHDALVSDGLLAAARHDAVIIDVGKRHSDHKLEQDEINALLAEHARQGRCVVRLKGGDPFVFGRGAEEAAYLGQGGVAVEVIPGVTAAVAAPAMAGIPVTHRLFSSAAVFITGHEDPDKGEPSHDYAALAGMVRAGATLCIYMGIVRLEAIVERLLRAGLDGDTPAAIVQWGATPRQRSARTTLANLPRSLKEHDLWAPAIIVIGRVAAIDDPALRAYTNRPLFGRRIIITRTRTQASAQRVKLAALGAEVLEAPTIRIVEPDEATWAKIDESLHNLARYDWLVLTSANGVEMLAQRMDRLGFDARHLAAVKVAAIGAATAEALRSRMNIRADLIPRTYVAESLAQELIALGGVGGKGNRKRFLLLRADIARRALPELLTDAGAAVDELPIYQNIPEASLPPRILDALRNGTADWITFTSSSTAKNMAALLGDEAALLRQTNIASIGPATSQTIRELGFKPVAEADPSDIDGLIATMVRYNARLGGTP